MPKWNNTVGGSVQHCDIGVSRAALASGGFVGNDRYVYSLEPLATRPASLAMPAKAAIYNVEVSYLSANSQNALK